ncbi:MAG: response regulator transcription factor [Lachnospiraceae bacterium]|nr:response regulator transcription factor [Lachnospiraceae bacterium]
MIHVMIADDHSMIREGLRQLLELDGDVRVMDEAGDGEECILKLREHIPDVLLLDINMPKMNGLEVLERIRELRLDVKVLILTVHNEVEYLLRAVDLGINGYLLKDSDSDELKDAILAVARGENFIQQELIPLMEKKMELKSDEERKLDTLTDREIEVLKLLSFGMFNKEIAEKLNISERTVKNHVSNIFKKIDVTDRTQAAVFSIRNKLINIH